MHKLDIWEVLRRLDRREFGWYESLSEEQRKGFSAPVALRFMSAVEDRASQDMMLVLTNEVANKHLFAIYDHPELQYKLLASCGLGFGQKHKWIVVAKSAAASKTLVQEFIQELYPSANEFELDFLIQKIDRKQLVQLTLDCALPSDRAKAIINAFDKAAKSK